MRYLAWPALVASLTMIITLIGVPSTFTEPGVQIESPAGSSLTPGDPVQHRPPGSANNGGKTSTGPAVESDHSGINEKARF